MINSIKLTIGRDGRFEWEMLGQKIILKHDIDAKHIDESNFELFETILLDMTELLKHNGAKFNNWVWCRNVEEGYDRYAFEEPVYRNMFTVGWSKNFNVNFSDLTRFLKRHCRIDLIINVK